MTGHARPPGVRQNGAKLIVANPMEVDFVRDADIWIRHNIGTDVALLMGMCRIIMDEGLQDQRFYVINRLRRISKLLKKN